MDFYRNGDYSPDAIKETNISFEKMFEEIPIYIKNSHLTNALLCEIEEKTPAQESYNYLDLATR